MCKNQHTGILEQLYSNVGLVVTKAVESEVFGWSGIPKKTRSWNHIFLSGSGNPIESFLHRTPKQYES